MSYHYILFSGGKITEFKDATAVYAAKYPGGAQMVMLFDSNPIDLNTDIFESKEANAWNGKGLVKGMTWGLLHEEDMHPELKLFLTLKGLI